MMSDISAGTMAGGHREDCWNEIVGLVRSKNVTPEGMTDDDIKTIVREDIPVTSSARVITTGSHLPGRKPWRRFLKKRA